MQKHEQQGHKCKLRDTKLRNKEPVDGCRRFLFLLTTATHLLLVIISTQIQSHTQVKFTEAFENQNNTGIGTQSPENDLSRESTSGFKAVTRRIVDDTRTINSTNATNQATLFIQATAIHVERAEFPLSKLLFKLTLKLALEQVERALAWRGVKISLNLRSANTCTKQFAGALAAEEYYTRRTRLLIISGCDDAIKSVSRLASVWQIPLMTAAGFSADFNDKQTHRSLTRVSFSLRTAVEFLVKIMNSYRWSRFNLLVDESDPNSPALRESIESNIAEMEAQRVNPSNHANLNILPFDLASLLQSTIDLNLTTSVANLTQENDPDIWPNELTRRAIGDILRQAALFSRVNVLLIPQAHVRKFMLSVYDAGMANGQYTFITIPLQLERAESVLGASEPQQQDNLFAWRALTSKRNGHAKQAYESLMSIYVKTPTTRHYNYFARNLTDLANSNYITNLNQQQQLVTKKRIQIDINPYSAAFYDCLQIYARALNESLNMIEAEKAPNKRRELRRSLHANLTSHMRDKRYSDMLTGTIYLNKNGDRETDYSLDDMNQMGKFWPVIWFDGQSRSIERLAPIRWFSDGSGECCNLCVCVCV